MNEDKVEEGMELSPLCSILTIYAILGGLKSQFLQSSILQHETCPWRCCCAFNSAPLPASILAVRLSCEHPNLLPGRYIIFQSSWDTGYLDTAVVFVMHRRLARWDVLALFMAGRCPEAGGVAPDFLSISDPRIGVIPAAHHCIRHSGCGDNLITALLVSPSFAFLKKKILPVKAPNFLMPA